MAKLTDHNRNEHATTLGRQTSFKGTLRFKDSLRIRGKFSGEIISPGRLSIEEGAEVRADIRVGSLSIGGLVQGNIIARDKLEMLATGKVIGNIKTAKLKISDGVIFDGKCEMIKDPDKIDIFGSDTEGIKKAIESDPATNEDLLAPLPENEPV